MSTRILVVDDEESLCDILKYNLEKTGKYRVDCSYRATEALERNLKVYSLFIVDIMMEHLNGYDFVQRLRCQEGTEKTPVIFCSALDGEDDKVTGLDLGGDDYITKPFVISEVLARVNAVLRRARANKDIDEEEEKQTSLLPDLVYKGIRIDRNTKKCSIDGEEVPLTKTEYDLMAFFLSHTGRIYSREEIISNVWPPDVLVSERAIDTNITRLRKKLGQYGNCIETRQGFGYGFHQAD